MVWPGSSETALSFAASTPSARSARAGARYRLADATTDDMIAQTRADMIGAGARNIAELKNAIGAQQQELARRADWAHELDGQVQRAGTALQRLRTEFDERSAWALALNVELETLRPIVDSFVSWPTDVLRPAASLQGRLARRIADNAPLSRDWESSQPPVCRSSEWQKSFRTCDNSRRNNGLAGYAATNRCQMAQADCANAWASSRFELSTMTELA